MIPKALLISIIIVLIVLLVSAIFLQKQKINKIVENEKETFLTGLFSMGPSGNDSSGLSGTGFSFGPTYAVGLQSKIDNLQKDMAAIKETQNKISTVQTVSGSNAISAKDFIVLKDDTDRRFKDLGASNNLFQTALNTKLSTLQETDKSIVNKTTLIDSSIKDFTNKLTTTNSNVAVIDGKLVALSTSYTSNMNVMQSNITDIRNKQASFDAKLNTSAANIQNIVKAELSSVSGALTSKLLQTSGSTGTLSNDIGMLRTNFTTFSSNQTKFNTDQSANIGTLKQASAALTESIAKAEKRIGEVNAMFSNYASKTEIATLARKTDLTPYVLRPELSNYVTTADSARFALKTDLANNLNLSSNALNRYLTITDASNAYALKSDLRQYALTSGLPQQVIMRTEMPLLATKNDLTNYTQKTEFAPLSTAVTDAKKTIDALKPVVESINSQYVKKTDLPALTAPSTAAATQLTMALQSTKTVTDSLTQSLGAVQASLGEYVKKTDAQAAYSKFALKTDLDPMARRTDLALYPTLSNVQSTYAAKTDLTAYAKLTDLNQYTKTADLSKTYATNTALGQYVTTPIMMSNFMTRDMTTQKKIDDLAALINQRLATLNQTAKSVFNIIEATGMVLAPKIRAHSSTYNQNMPAGWNDGLMSADIYATGKIGVGTNGSVESSMNNMGEITGRKFKSIGDSNAWNWYHVYRNEGDQLYFGGDNTNRGIVAKGNRDFAIQTNNINGMVMAANGDVRFNNINVNGRTVLKDLWSTTGDYQSLGTKNLWATNIIGGPSPATSACNVRVYNNLTTNGPVNANVKMEPPGNWRGLNIGHSDGRYTHFDYVGDNKNPPGWNYIRGNTKIDDILFVRGIEPKTDDPDPKIHLGWGGPEGQSVIIGNSNSSTWFNKGNITTASQINLQHNNAINFGSTFAKGSNINAGKIGYGILDGGANGTLNIIGGSTSGIDRRTTISDHLTVTGNTLGVGANYTDVKTDTLQANKLNSNTHMEVDKSSSIRFGGGYNNREGNAGRIGYGLFDGGENGTLNIVGGGPANWPRQVTVCDSLRATNSIGVGWDMPRDWRGANFKRADGRWTHFDWVGDGKNYIRGDTTNDGEFWSSENINAAKGVGARTGVWTPALYSTAADGSINIDTPKVTFRTGVNMYTPGRQHISGDENLYLLNKGGTIVSKAWGGNGNLTVEGDLNSTGNINTNKGIGAVGGMWTPAINVGGRTDNKIDITAGVTTVNDLKVNGCIYLQNNVRICPSHTNGYVIQSPTDDKGNYLNLNGGYPQDRLWVQGPNGYWYWNAQANANYWVG